MGFTIHCFPNKNIQAHEHVDTVQMVLLQLQKHAEHPCTGASAMIHTSKNEYGYLTVSMSELWYGCSATGQVVYKSHSRPRR